MKCVTENLGECRVIAAANDKKGKIVITNPTEKDMVIQLNTGEKPSRMYAIDKDTDYNRVNILHFMFNKYLKLKAETVILIEYDF